jgi:hypothetical protein
VFVHSIHDLPADRQITIIYTTRLGRRFVCPSMEIL